MPSMTINEIFKKNDDNKLVLPDFQRDFVWDKDQQKNLLASFITYLPVGSILLLEGSKDDFANKRMCFPEESCLPKDECIYLLDGQQRITSLKSIFTDLFYDTKNWKYIWNNIYRPLRNRWFIRVIPKEGEEDIFGYKRLNFRNLKKYEPNEVVNFIEYKQIFKTKTHDWYNPGFIVTDTDNKVISNGDINKRNYYIAEYASKEGLVPLFTLYKGESHKVKPLHEYVIQRIGRDRVGAIKAEINDINDNCKRNEKIKNYLTDIEPNIDIFIENEEKSNIDAAWSNLSAKWSRDILNYLDGILCEKISTIELLSSEINRAVAIFESINKGGTPLDTYDLIVAKAAKDKSLMSLSKRLLGHLQNKVKLNSAINDNLKITLSEWYPKYIKLINDNELTKIFKNQFLNMLSILSYGDYGNVDEIRNEYIKKNKILNLSSEQINYNEKKAVKSLIRAASFLQMRCGIMDIKELPYELMILPVAYCLIDDNVWNDKSSINKIEYWYWTCLFSGAYRERQNQQCINDISNLYKWINKKQENPYCNYEKKVLDESGYSDKDTLLLKDNTHDIQTSIKKGILQYIISQEPRDFIYDKLFLTAWKIGSEQTFKFDKNDQLIKVEDHHICPLNSCTKISESTKILRSNKKHILNSPLNRTYISSISNKKISDMKPEKYFEYVCEVAQYGHYIPSPIKKYFNKHNEESYEEFLSDRYNEIRKSLVMELDRLKY